MTKPPPGQPPADDSATIIQPTAPRPGAPPSRPRPPADQPPPDDGSATVLHPAVLPTPGGSSRPAQARPSAPSTGPRGQPRSEPPPDYQPPPDDGSATVLQPLAPRTASAPSFPRRPQPPPDDGSATVLQPPPSQSRPGGPSFAPPRPPAARPAAGGDGSETIVDPIPLPSRAPASAPSFARSQQPARPAAPPQPRSFDSEGETIMQPLARPAEPARPTRPFAAPELPGDLVGTLRIPPPPASPSAPGLAQSLGDTASGGPPRTVSAPPRTVADPAASGPGAGGERVLEARPGDAIGGYEVERTLGRGGMGIVYLARDPRLSRRVALKVLPMTAATDEAAALRFKREAEALAALDHPGIRPCFGWGRDDEARVFWLAMGYVEGRPYDAVVQDEVGLGHESPRRAARVVRDAARALSFAHRRGVIHRDVKPSNIMLEAAPEVDGGLKVHVVDFGLARLDGSAELTVEGQVMGTLKFMPPEQALGAEASALSDVYSLGATLFWALTGEGPYEAKRIENLQMKVSRGDEPRRPGALRRDCPPDLEAIVLEALELEPVQRYATADALADDLERWLSGQPVLARPPSAGRRARAWLRARRAVLLPVAALLVGLAVAAAAWAGREPPEVPAARARLLEIEGEAAGASLGQLAKHQRELAGYRDAAWLPAGERARVEGLEGAVKERLLQLLATDGRRLDAAIDAWRAAGPDAPGPDGAPSAAAATALGVARALSDWSDVQELDNAGRELARLAGDVAQLAAPDGAVLRDPTPDVALSLVPHRSTWPAGAKPGVALSTTERVKLPAWGVLLAAGTRRPPTLQAVMLLDPARALREPALPLPPAVKETETTAGLVAVAGPGDAPAFLIDAAPVSREAFAAFVRKRWSDDALWDEAGLAWRRVRHSTPPAPESGEGPVEVSHHAARAFARSRGLRLPSWSELGRAAGGPGWSSPDDPAGLGLARDRREWTQDSVWDGARAQPDRLAPEGRLGFRCACDLPGR